MAEATQQARSSHEDTSGGEAGVAGVTAEQMVAVIRTHEARVQGLEAELLRLEEALRLRQQELQGEEQRAPVIVPVGNPVVPKELLKKPQDFRGEGEDVEVWVEHFEKYRTFYHLEETQIL